MALLPQDSWADQVAGILAWAVRLHSGLEVAVLPVAGMAAVAVVAGWAVAMLAPEIVIVTEEVEEDEEVAAPADHRETWKTEADAEELAMKTTRTKAPPVARVTRARLVHAVVRVRDLDPAATTRETARETAMQTRTKTNQGNASETKDGTRSVTAAAIETGVATELVETVNVHENAEEAERESVVDLVLAIATHGSAETGIPKAAEQPEVAASRESVGVKVGNRYKLPSRIADNYYRSDWIASLIYAVLDLFA